MKRQSAPYSKKNRMVSLLTWFAIWVAGRTTRKTWVNWNVLESFEASGQPAIFSLWHNNLLYFTYVLKGKNLGAMVSPSRDGQEIGWVLSRFGFVPVYGSSSQGGTGALRTFLKMLSKGQSVSITPDGPRGPRYETKPGTVAMAVKRNVPVVPLAFSGPSCWEFGSWDRMRLPKPFSKTTIVAGAPLWPKNFESETEFEHTLELEMRKLVAQTDSLVGGSLVNKEPLLQESRTPRA